MKTPTRPHQHGLSMIELLVALAISSFLILGITQIYIDNKRNYSFQQSQLGNQESARFAELMLNDYLNKVGYRRDPMALPEFAFPEESYDDCEQFAKGSSITASKDKLGICLRYQPVSSNDLDCQGDSALSSSLDAFESPNSSQLIVLALWYEPAGADKELHTGALMCKSLNASKPTETELVGGVADFRLEFGVGPDDQLSKSLTTSENRFVKAADWKEDSHGPIRAVRYSLLMASQPNRRDGDSNIFESWLEHSAAATKTRLQSMDNNRLYQIASSTQAPRNLMP